MKTIYFLLFSLLFSCAIAAESRSLSWGELRGKLDFDDPFTALSEEQLYQLSIYAQVEALKASAPEQVSTKLLESANEAQKFLIHQNIDIDYLLANRERVTNLRREAAGKTNPELDNADIEISGFMHPLDRLKNEVDEFLLLNTPETLIHHSPPATNQIVYVKLKKPVEVSSRFKAIRVRGTLSIKQNIHRVLLNSGPGDIYSSYTLEADEVEEIRAAGE